MVELSMDVQGQKELLSVKLKETEGREMYSADEVRDMLLDLWLLLIEDSPEEN